MFLFRNRKDLIDLVNLQKDHIADLTKKVEKIDSWKKLDVSFVQPPSTQKDVQEIEKKIAILTEDSGYLFFLDQLRKRVVEEFESGTTQFSADYYRGKLAAIGDIIMSSKQAVQSANMSAIIGEEE